MKFRNLHIGTRLGLGFGLVLILLVMLALTSLSRMASIQKSLDNIIHKNNVIVKELGDMRQSVMRVVVAVGNASVTIVEDELKAEATEIEAASAEYKQSAAVLETLITDAKGTALLASVAEGEAMTTPGIEKAIMLAMRQADVIPILRSDVVPHQRKWIAAMDDMIAYQEVLSKETSTAAASTYSNALTLTVALAAAALLLGALIAWQVTRSIVVPLRGAVDVARRVASGDLTTRVVVESKDETGQLLEALKDMNESLVRIVREVRTGTDTITRASGEIASGNMDLSSRTEEQASSLQMTASSMEELTSTVKHNSENANQANKLGTTASQVAVKGGAVVSQVVETMGSINESAKKIVDIIGVIDGIAFQTNILALNAAVEAARAGEQGRGFAVVASEVRNLAQRSAAAAKEIKALIDNSVEKVDAGSKLVDQAGHTMNEVVTSVGRVTDIISEIAAASREQTSGIEQINQSIIQMDNATQQNAALVEQAAAAAKSLQEQASSLSEVVSVFKVHEEETAVLHRIDQTPERLRERVIAPQSSRTAVASVPVMHRSPAQPRVLPPVMKTGTDNADWEEF